MMTGCFVYIYCESVVRVIRECFPNWSSQMNLYIFAYFVCGGNVCEWCMCILRIIIFACNCDIQIFRVVVVVFSAFSLSRCCLNAAFFSRTMSFLFCSLNVCVITDRSCFFLFYARARYVHTRVLYVHFFSGELWSAFNSLCKTKFYNNKTYAKQTTTSNRRASVVYAMIVTRIAA